MSPDWISFGIIIFVQAVFLLLSAIYYKKLDELPHLLLYGIIIGTVIGLAYDLILGKYLGLFSYRLGFETIILLVNASLSYGLFVTSALLVERVGAIHFTVWLCLLIITYEVTNVFYPVWSYNFTLPLLPFFVLCLVGYSSGALTASFISTITFKRPFALEIKR